MATTKKPEALEPPDLLEAAGKAQVLAENIQNLQSQRFRLDTLQTINDSADGDPIPTNNGGKLTFTARREQIDAAIKRLVEKNPDLMVTVEALLAAQAAAAAADED